MAVIGKIRKRTGLLITIIAIAILGFLLMDATNSQSGVIRPGSNVLGEVGDQTINSIQFEERVRALEEERKAQKGSTRAQLTEEERRSIRQEAWNNFVENAVMDDLFEEIGLRVTPEEVEDMTVGTMPHPFVVSQFVNPNTGQFDALLVRNFIETIDLPDPNVEPAVKRAQWMAFERAIVQDRERSKLNDIVVKGLYVPEWQKELKKKEIEQSVDLDYVFLPMSDIPDEEVNVSEEEIKKYLKKNAKLYKQDAYRSMNFVAFDIKPSAADSAMILRDIQALKKEFKNTENDSIFLRLNSSEPYIDRYYKREEIAVPGVDTLFSMEKGSVIGPIIHNDKYMYAKLLSKKRIADSVRLRQIVFDFNTLQNQNQADRKRKLHDSVYVLLDSLNMDFVTLVNAFSDDAATKANGGDIGWLKYEDASSREKSIYFYNSEEGSIKKEVQLDQNKLRIVEVVKSKPADEAIKVGYLSKNILPSEETERGIYASASKFSSENRTQEAFNNSATLQGLNVQNISQIEENASFIPSIGYQSRPIVRWLYEEKTKVGEVSRVFSTSEKHIVAVLTEKAKEGIQPVDKVETEIRTILTNKKKGEMLADKMSSGSSLEEIAGNLNTSVQSISGMKTTNAQIPGGSWELNVAHTALNLDEGQVSDPIIGNGGAYVIKVKSKTPVTTDQLNIYKRNIKQEYISSANQKLIEALRDRAQIEDNRSKFF